MASSDSLMTQCHIALFADFARLTVAAARARYGEGGELHAVLKAWPQGRRPGRLSATGRAGTG